MGELSRDYLFVYGTLRRDSQNEMYKLLARHAKFYSDGWINGRLYVVTYYPCAILSLVPGEKVYGEIYELIDGKKILPSLDEYEECGNNFPEPWEYRREKVVVHLDDSKEIEAWAYIYNRDVGNLLRIESGDFYNQSQGC